MSSGPFAGIKVVDLTSVVMGPYATQILGDMGAEVIKVESPDGDIMRHMGVAKNKAMGPIHLSVNRNKKSLVLDLQKEAGLKALINVMTDADVFVHAMRPAAIERLGLGYNQVKKIKSDIVYCGAYGFGKGGAYSEDPAYDDMIQGVSGLCSLNASLAGEPRFTPTIIGDKVAGLTMAYSIMAALYHKLRTGEGQSIEVPMFETLTSFMLVEHIGGRVFDKNNGKAGYARVLSQLRKPHRTTNGYLCVLPYTDKNWKDFFKLAGREDLSSDPRYVTANNRSQNYETLYKALADIMALRRSEDWLRDLKKLSIPVAPVNSLDDLFSDQHLSDVGMFFEREHPTEGMLTQTRPPVTFSKSPSSVNSLAPGLGQHSHQVLRTAGLTESELRSLIDDGITNS